MRPLKIVVIAVVLLLPVLYVLSSGPAFVLQGRESISEDGFNLVYAPLLWACDKSSYVWETTSAYWRWCVDRACEIEGA